jgi:hypothetical protein
MLSVGGGGLLNNHREGWGVENTGSVTGVYIIQVMARHGVGSQGWRTVRRPSGEPYCFQTHDAALAALRKHFPALREEHDVRVHVLADAPGSF